MLTALFFLFWLGIPIVLLILFALFKPKLAPLTLLICPVLDLIFYWQEFLYYEGRPFILLFTALQLTFIAAACLTLWLRRRK